MHNFFIVITQNQNYTVGSKCTKEYVLYKQAEMT